MPSSKPIDGKCGAKLKARDGFCKNPPLANGRCRYHGGLTPAPGPDHPNYKHGKYSKLKLPTGLAQRIADAVSDPNLLSLHEDVALVKARICELLEDIESIAQPETWKSVKALAGEIRTAVVNADTEAALAACDRLTEIAIGSDVIMQNHREIVRLIEQRRRLSESERKAKIEAGHLITAAQAVAILDRFVGSVMDVLKDDPDKRREVHRHYAASLGVYEPPEQQEVARAS